MFEPGHIYAGYYTTQVSNALEHTFAAGDLANGKTVYFACFGGIRGKNQVDRAPLYTNEIIKFLRKSIGRYMPADIYKARCIAEFSITPEIKDQYDAKTGGPSLMGDTSGLLYGVTGVCHQMCNRILYAMSYRRRFFNDAAVVWPPSLDISRVLYLHDGTLPSQPPWRIFLQLLADVIKHLDVIKDLPRTEEPRVTKLLAGATKEFRKTEEDLFIASLQSQLDSGYAESNSRQMVLQSTLGKATSLQLKAKKGTVEEPTTGQLDIALDLVPLHQELLAKKKDLDLPLFEGRISKEDYVRNLNEIVRGYLRQAEKLMPLKDYALLFGIAPGAEIPDIASVVEMPDLQKYREIGKQLRF